MGSPAQGCDGWNDVKSWGDFLLFLPLFCSGGSEQSKYKSEPTPHHTTLQGKQRLATPLPSAGIWTSQSQGSDH